MFVVTGAKTRVIQKRREEFFAQQLPSLIRQAQKLGIDKQALCAAIAREREEA